MTPRCDLLSSSDRSFAAGVASGGFSSDRVILQFERDPETAERARVRLQELLAEQNK